MGAQTRYTRSSVANIKRFGKKLIKLAEKTPKSKLNLVKNGERKKSDCLTLNKRYLLIPIIIIKSHVQRQSGKQFQFETMNV